ncbi:MAG: glutamate-1-semialdehyde 2,1-aminomutase [Elusimicrobia bacterium CG08_land_8_20_14_0_20_51_18]|nr:MAG: glutamate-1-semialdehyde 2,1-aminomutase [Elusimicrobia bacterium CG08_land_8_20_14_0_20_51_18]
MTEKLKLENSERLYKEAQELIPGGMMGIRRPYNFVPGEYPIFFEEGKGGKVIDADGNEYIDMLCAYGPIIMGHREKEIDKAAMEQIKNKGFCMSLVQSIQNKLAKKVTEIIPSAEKVVFLKTGSDATTLSTRVARGYTDKTKILRCGYHGWHDWCVEVKGGIPKKLYEDVFEFEYNNLDQLESLMKEHGPDAAAVIVTPVGHPLAHPVQMPKPGFLEGVKELAHKYGAVLVFDEIRSGFRFSMGGAQKVFGVTPDLSVFGKAMANGYDISMLVGKKEIMDVLVQKVFVSSTYFPNSISMAASLKTIEIMERDNILEEIKKRGGIFVKRVAKYVKRSKLPIELSGGELMPYITFNKDEKGLYKKMRNEFYAQLIRRKVFLQPYHHGYVCYRHSPKDMRYAADMVGEALEIVKSKV